MTFGEHIRKLRLQRHFSQKKVADDLGLSQSAITSFERGINEPSFETCRRFADYFHVSVYSLLPFAEEKDDGSVEEISELILYNPKLHLLFDLSKYFKDSDLDALITVAGVINKQYQSGEKDE